MSTYVPLPAVWTTAAIDTSGFNPGNYTNGFTAGVLNINVPVFELYHASVTQVPPGATGTIQVGSKNYVWGFTFPASTGSEYAPPNGLLLTPNTEFYFLWSTGTGTKPLVVCYFRADIDIPVNRRNLGQYQ